jgi:hypothetical protein
MLNKYHRPMAIRDAARQTHRECRHLGHRLGRTFMGQLLDGHHRVSERREVVGEWVRVELIPAVRSVPGLADDPVGKTMVGAAFARAALDLGSERGARTRAVVLLLEICGACHHVLGYEPELRLHGTGRDVRVELVAA